MITGLHRTNSFQFLYKFRRLVSSQTHYDTLGIKKSASYSEIRSAFIKLSKKYHPDKNDGDIETFKRINEAYSVLSQEKSRRIYDSSLVSRAKPLFTNSPNEYDVSDWERNYNYHLRSLRFGENKRNTKGNPNISRSIFISTILLAAFIYFISIYKFIKK
ncbi:unnamed protein product, partial [Schistosoma curassoni]|uniref:J domain-containing protein n=1 Tax=Schistosoma curassoni TaxID=6186 RepID=A0A183L2U0_9TREM